MRTLSHNDVDDLNIKFLFQIKRILHECSSCCRYKGSYMGTLVLLNLLNQLGKIKARIAEYFIFLATSFLFTTLSRQQKKTLRFCSRNTDHQLEVCSLYTELTVTTIHQCDWIN